MAALHVIHQAGYVADSYRDKRPEPHGLAGFSRGIDYGLLASSLFVLATFKFTGASLRVFGMDLSQHQFTTGGRQLLFPGVLRDEVFAWAALLAFVLCAAAPVPTGKSNRPRYLRMYKVPMAATPSPVDESSGFKLSDQFPDFPRHGVAMLFFWRLSPRGDGVKERSPSQQPRAPADVADSYGAKRPEPTGPGGGSRRNDYGVRGSSLSRGPRSVHRPPLRLFVPDRSRGPFTTGGRQLLFPGVLRDEVFAWAALLAFVLCAAAYLIKCGYEVAQRRLTVPNTLHMTLAASLFFITPALQNLDVAFQGLNTWHSFQYKAHGMIGSATVARFPARGWGLCATGTGLTAACHVLFALRGLMLLTVAQSGCDTAALVRLLCACDGRPPPQRPLKQSVTAAIGAADPGRVEITGENRSYRGVGFSLAMRMQAATASQLWVAGLHAAVPSRAAAGVGTYSR